MSKKDGTDVDSFQSLKGRPKACILPGRVLRLDRNNPVRRQSYWGAMAADSAWKPFTLNKVHCGRASMHRKIRGEWVNTIHIGKEIYAATLDQLTPRGRRRKRR